MRSFDSFRTRCLQCFFVASALVLTTACEQEADPSKPGYWVAKLDKKPTRVEALKELGKLGPAAKEAVPEVTRWLEEEGAWQPDAAYTLGQIGDAASVAALRQALDFSVGAGRDRKTRLRNRVNQRIALALAELGAKDAVADLLQLVEAPEPKTRDAVLRALGKLGDPAAADAMMEVAENDEEPFIRRVAIESLGELRAPKAVPTLVKMLYLERGDGQSHYLDARFSLVKMGRTAVPKLLETLERKNEDVEKMQVAGKPLARGAIEAKAGSTLGAIRATEAEGQIIGAHQSLYKEWQRTRNREPEASVVGAVIELTYALGDLGTDKAMKRVVEMVDDTEPAIRLSATEALTTIGDSAAVPALIRAAGKGGVDARAAALIAASQLGSGSDLSAFDAMGKGELEPVVKAERVRLVAAQECQEDAACWKKKIADDEARVAARAAFQLGRLSAKDASPELLKAVEHESPQVRMAAVLSLEALGAVDVARFESILDDAKKRVEYGPVNNQMLRIIALA
ncbi:MAG: HEAT repeat domain-containing protein, partial [Myxococcota bacterium]